MLAPAVERPRSTLRRRVQILAAVGIGVCLALGLGVPAIRVFAGGGSLAGPGPELRTQSMVDEVAEIWLRDAFDDACPPIPDSLTRFPDRLHDRWGRPVRLFCEATFPHRVMVSSAGEDGRFETDDDVYSQSENYDRRVYARLDPLGRYP